MTKQYIDLLTEHKVKLLCLRERVSSDSSGFSPFSTKKQSVHYRILRSYKDTLHGAVGGIRTLVPLLTTTRFPVVLVMTSSIPLHILFAANSKIYYTKFLPIVNT